MTDNRKLRVFLCHSSQDKPIVRELYQRLNAEGWIDPWLDEEKLLPGMDWDMEIEKAVEAADSVIICLSNNSVTKEGYVQRELKFVLDIALEKPEGTIFIIPLRFDDVQPPRRLRSWQYADYFPPDHRELAYMRLRESLRLKANRLFVAFDDQDAIISNSTPEIVVKPRKIEKIILRYLTWKVNGRKVFDIRRELIKKNYEVKIDKDDSSRYWTFPASSNCIYYGDPECLKEIRSELENVSNEINLNLNSVRTERIRYDDSYSSEKQVIIQFVDNTFYI